MKKNEFNRDLTNVEIEGTQIMFNKFMQEHLDLPTLPKFGFFYCDQSICSEDSANGKPIIFEGKKVKYLTCLSNGLTYVICEGKNEKEFIFEFNCYNGEFYDVTKAFNK